LIKLLFLFLLASKALTSVDKQCNSISIEKENLCVELAISQREKSKGLMYRKDLSNTDGMLFIWKNEDKRCMWMKNTYISLDLGFFREDLTLIEVKDLSPRSLESVCSSEPAKYALELPKGWFSSHNIKNNSKLVIN
tara:strand:- start:1284 stop:1694 length:411 start_codon:yes stop_codon:yes gene_type:complete